MIYLVACILERLFGPEMIEDIEGIRGNLSIPNIIDAVQSLEDVDEAEIMLTDNEEQPPESVETSTATLVAESITAQPSFNNLKPVQSFFEPPPMTAPSTTVKSAFSDITSSHTTFGTSNVFGGAAFGAATTPRTARSTSAFASVFGGPKTSVAVSPNRIFVSVLLKQQQVASMDSIKSKTDVAEGAMQPPTQLSSSSEPNGTNSILPSHPLLNPSATVFVPSTFTPPTIFQNTLSPLKPSFVPPTTTDEPQPAVTESHPVQPIVRQLSTSSSRRSSFTLPKINTSISNATNVTPSTMQPPQLAKVQPIALPSTPTTTPPQPNGISSLVKANLSVSYSTNDMLSPLPLSTSGLGLVQNFSPVPSPSKPITERKAQRRTSVAPSGKGKGKEVESTAQAPTHEAMRAQALGFAQKGFLVKQYFEIWKQRAIKHAAWLEACRQSDSYRRKVRAQRQARAEMAEKKRKSMRSTIVSDTSPKKRIRKRISTEYQPPRTDEELAQRLKEVQILPLKSVPLIGSMSFLLLLSSRTMKRTHIVGREGPSFKL